MAVIGKKEWVRAENYQRLQLINYHTPKIAEMLERERTPFELHANPEPYLKIASAWESLLRRYYEIGLCGQGTKKDDIIELFEEIWLFLEKELFEKFIYAKDIFSDCILYRNYENIIILSGVRSGDEKPGYAFDRLKLPDGSTDWIPVNKLKADVKRWRLEHAKKARKKKPLPPYIQIVHILPNTIDIVQGKTENNLRVECRKFLQYTPGQEGTIRNRAKEGGVFYWYDKPNYSLPYFAYKAALKKKCPPGHQGAKRNLLNS